MLKSLILQPWILTSVYLAAFATNQQQKVIRYLLEENRVLKQQLGKRKPQLNNRQRVRLALKGKELGRKLLGDVCSIVTPDTILRWHRQLVAQKWDHSHRRQQQPGRPRIRKVVVETLLRLAKQNPGWGYQRICSALNHVGYPLAKSTVANILKEHGLEPSPKRSKTTSWKTFLKAHWDAIAAADFTTIEVWTPRGLVTFYLLFVMELKTRRVHFAGSTTQPDGAWMNQVARNLTDCEDGILSGKQILLIDRDTKFTDSFKTIVQRESIEAQLLPPSSPNLNAHIERFMRSIKDECLNRMIFFGERSLRNAVRQYLIHYHLERHHQGLDHRIIQPVDGDVGNKDPTLPLQKTERLGGMLNYYHRDSSRQAA